MLLPNVIVGTVMYINLRFALIPLLGIKLEQLKENRV